MEKKEDKKEEKQQKKPWYVKVKEKVVDTAKVVGITMLEVAYVIKENKEVMAAVITTAATVGSLAYKSRDRQKERQERKWDGSTCIEDKVTGRTIYLTRPLTVSEQMTFDYEARRVDESGKTYFQILYEIDPDLIDE